MAVRIGIIGPGGISDDQHGPALSRIEGAVLWSVLSRDLARAKRFADRHGAQSPSPAHCNLDAMLNDPDLHAVIVATPDRFHASQTVAAARAGKHVLVEKPMATSVEDARVMIDACHEADLRLGIAYHLRWHAGHREMRKRVHNGELGELRHVRMHWTFKAADGTNWRASPVTGRWWSLAANGTHCLDLIRWIFVPMVGEITDIKALCSHSVWDTTHDESAIVSIRFESGATAEFFSSVLFDSPSRIEIYGSKGIAVCEGTLGRHGSGRITLADEPVVFSVSNAFEEEIRDFVNAIIDAREPEVNGVEGMRNVELLTRATTFP